MQVLVRRLWNIKLKKCGRLTYTEVWALSPCRVESLKLLLKKNVIKNTDRSSSDVQNGPEVIGK